MALVLSVAMLLILISENTYQKAVFRPYFRKLENAEVPADDLKPLLEEFLSYLGTEELNQAISEGDREDSDASLYVWLLNQPGLKEPPLSVYDDWMEFEITLYQIRGKTDLHEISCFAEKDGNRYCICTVLDNEDSIRGIRHLRQYDAGERSRRRFLRFLSD